MILRLLIYGLVALALVACAADHPEAPVSNEWYDDVASAGECTVFDVSSNAFGRSLPNLGVDEKYRFGIGNSFFRNSWVQAPASTAGRDGLGPFFHSRSCGGCHHLDGRGAPPKPGEQPIGLLLRLNHDPVYGNQFDVFALPGISAEGTYSIAYRDSIVVYDDGTAVTLRVPTYSLTDLAYGNLAPSTHISPRLAQQIIGLGLLEAINESDIDRNLAMQGSLGLAGTDRRVRNTDGSYVRGRFGWKSGTSTVHEQSTAAFIGDMGLTTSQHPQEDLTPHQRSIITNIYSGGSPEVNDTTVMDVVKYVRNLAVPARRNIDNTDVRNGAVLFQSIGCANCHTHTYTTGADHVNPSLRNQKIHPFTDLLLHDMGPGLADAGDEGDVARGQWRTPPLWGIGLIHIVNGEAHFLHDGRAGSMEEAIVWHGGEAAAAARKFKALNDTQRRQLIRFLESL